MIFNEEESIERGRGVQGQSFLVRFLLKRRFVKSVSQANLIQTLFIIFSFLIMTAVFLFSGSKKDSIKQPSSDLINTPQPTQPLPF